MERRRVVTERDVRRAAADSAAEIDVRGGSITPAAIDLAHRLGISLRGLPGEDRKLRRSGKPQSEARGQRPEARGTESSDVRPVDSRAAGSPTSDIGSALRIAVAADHGGVSLKDAIVSRLRELGHSVVDHGTMGSEPVDYPDFALAVARELRAGAAQLGIMVDGAGIGSCMVANKVAGVRAAMCHDVTTAKNAREHNHANMLTLGGGLIGTRLGLEIVETFIATPFGGGRHARRVAKIDALDRPEST